MDINTSRSMTTSHLGPTAGEMRKLLEKIPDNVRINVNYDHGYNQFDPGSITFTVTTRS